MPRRDALTRFADWFDDRLGYRRARQGIARRLQPEGPRWGLALSVGTLGMFLVVAFTGIALMTGYSPASDHGWSSVFHIESTPGGSFLRGLHYYGSHALIILFAIHLARMILTASFRAPRDLAWIAGVLLLPLLATAAVTGNPLSASNKAIGQIAVESHILGNMPLVGNIVRGLLVGGEEIGHLTMTRLYTLHVVVLPLLAGLLLALHIHQQIRHTAVDDEDDEPVEEPTSPGPRQSARNALVFGVVFAIVAFLAWRIGVPLNAPADPTLTSMPRPEWYFRSLFELRHQMSGAAEFLATGLFPLLFLLLLVLLPWIDRLLGKVLSGWFRYALVIGGVVAWVGLTFQSYAHDRDDPDYQAFLVEADEMADRAKLLAKAKGIPPHGPAALLQSDPRTQGPLLFARHCANCHAHVDEEGHGISAKTPAAANLYGFASREWIAGLLDPEQIAEGDYFGHTAFVQGFASMGMIDYVQNQLYEVDNKDERRAQVAQAVLALSAEAQLPTQAEADKADAQAIAAGRTLLAGDALGCVECHKFREAGEIGGLIPGPDLTGYGSREWLRDFIADPTHERFYNGNNDGMPSFRPAENGSPQNILTEQELLLIVDWLRGDWVREGESGGRGEGEMQALGEAL